MVTGELKSYSVLKGQPSTFSLFHKSAQMVSLRTQVPLAMDQIKLTEVGDEAKDDRDRSTLKIFYKKFSYQSLMEPTQAELRCFSWEIQVGSIYSEAHFVPNRHPLFQVITLGAERDSTQLSLSF